MIWKKETWTKMQKALGLNLSSAITHYASFQGESIFSESWKILMNNFIQINFYERQGTQLLITEHLIQASTMLGAFCMLSP